MLLINFLIHSLFFKQQEEIKIKRVGCTFHPGIGKAYLK